MLLISLMLNVMLYIIITSFFMSEISALCDLYIIKKTNALKSAMKHHSIRYNQLPYAVALKSHQLLYTDKCSLKHEHLVVIEVKWDVTS